MPEKIVPKGRKNFTDLSPTQVRVSNVIEVGSEFHGKLEDLIPTCCDCQRCEDCQKDNLASILDNEIGINMHNGSPIKIAREVTYELAQEGNLKNETCTILKSRLIFEMSSEDFKKLTNKEKFVEIGTSKAGLKQYQIRTEE